MSEFISGNEQLPHGLMEFARGVTSGADARDLIREHRRVIDAVTPHQTMTVLDNLLREGFTVAETKAAVGKILNMFHMSLASYEWEKPGNGHFLHHLMLENREAEKRMETLRSLTKRFFHGKEEERTTIRQAMLDAVMTLDPTLSTEPINARFDWNDAGPVLVPGADGVGIDVQAVSDAIMAATKTPERIAETDAVTVPPEVTTEYLESMGITEMIVHFSTPLTSEPTRTQNIRHATEFITGTLVPPGGRFDTLAVIGPITYANGYIDSGMVINGLHIDGLGGGLSQIGTMTFNAGFEAGYIDVEHHPHSYWFTRYPAGREATLSVPTKNVIWENVTPYGALLRAYVSGGRVYIEVWSTRYWDVSITDSGKYNIRPVQTEVSHDPRCVPYGGGNAGFTITVTRTKTAPDGTPGETWQQTTSYRPDNAYTCE